jgi:hypothetical protein
MRATSDDDLQIFRLRVRGELLEKLLSALYGGVLGSIPGGRESAAPIRSALLLALEWHAESSDEDLLRHPVPELGALDDSERALLADEFRDVVSELKSFVEGLTDGSENKT